MQAATPDNDKLHIEVAVSSNMRVFTWLGSSRERDPSVQIKEFFRPSLETTDSRGVVLDFTRLEYMNSATVSPIIDLMRVLNEKGVKTSLRFRKDVTWQRINCSCMRVLARSLPLIQVEEIE